LSIRGSKNIFLHGGKGMQSLKKMINNILASWVEEINKLTQKTSAKEHKSTLTRIVKLIW
jgi:hypothetical protein